MRRERHRQPGEELELRVGLHQLVVVADDGGHDGAPGHAVGLAQRQHRERLREEQQALEVVDHHQADARRGAAVTPTIIQRRPPTERSRAGPMKGVTTASGAIVSAR